MVILTLGEFTKEQVKPFVTFVNPALGSANEATLDRVHEVGAHLAVQVFDKSN